MSVMVPVFSPDSGYIFYVLQDYENNKSIAFMSDTKTGETRKTETYEHIGSVVFSPDGAWFVYMAGGQGKYFMVKSGFGWISGQDIRGPEHEMLENISIAPDGRHIAYAVKRGQKSSVVITDADLDIKKQGEAYEAVTGPVFSADGKEVVYKALSEGEYVLKVENIE